ncbi:MAG: GNAT family N-acetyltransferase [Thermoanaerobaculales bacterium]|jgi:RimJ/RimL family protein N-acetyltransferase|nr:GNAT family N-acetyltransferase [Thermoanaerobaculales bacterium]
MAYGWEGEAVRLVPLERGAHLDNALRWFNDPEITAWLETGDWPLTRGAEEEFFRSTERPDKGSVHFAVETLAGEHVGFSGLRSIDWQSRVAVSGSVIGRADLWGRGLGTDSARVRSRYAFEVLGLRMLIATVIADNARSMGMLTAVGYRQVGRVPGRYWKRGAWRDQAILVLESPAG